MQSNLSFLPPGHFSSRFEPSMTCSPSDRFGGHHSFAHQRFIYIDGKRTSKRIFFFSLCRCSMWTLNWNLYERERFPHIRKKAIFTGRNEAVAKVMFSQASVILLTGGGPASVHAGIPPPRTRPPPGRRHHPPGADTTPPQEQTPTPQEQTPPNQTRHPPGADPPGAATPTSTPPKQTPHRNRHTPPPRSRHPREADSSIRSMSGQYASYWNAFLFL